jgi:PAT family beta-lactamase induction signal transducer AmpG
MNFLHKLFNRKILIILLMGFSSGLPLALIGGTLQAWMKSAGVSLGTISLFAIVGLPYTIKFLWAPLMDRFSLFHREGPGHKKVGRRKSWMFITQIGLAASILFLGWSDPKDHLTMLALLSLLVSFFSASQDIVIDAWRRESLSDEELGFGSSVHVASYLFAFRMVSGALALILADHLAWSEVYTLMALLIGVGLLATIFCEEPDIQASAPRTLRESVIEPFFDYFARPGAITILVFILLYKLGDNMATQMTIPFYLDLGFSKTEIGTISKIIGWVSLALGGLVGGALMIRMKMLPSLLLFGGLQAASTFGFAILALMGKSMGMLTFVIAAENFAAGMSTTAFVAFMAMLTNKRFTATQYALLTSFMGIPRVLLVAPTGYIAEATGWFWFFTLCTVIAVPGFLMVFWMRRYIASSGN